MMVTKGLWLATIVGVGLLTQTCVSASPYRSDGRCRGSFLAPNGQVAKCNPKSSTPCCSNNNRCGSSPAYCQCRGCIDYRITGKRFRNDRRCGPNYLAKDGRRAACDPRGLYPCCSNDFWCGRSSSHCMCEGCLDYRITGDRYRKDRRCGGNNLARDGRVARCDPNGRYPCCSSEFRCGISSAHCTCRGCLDYRITGDRYRKDRRCGGSFLARNGRVAECDPDGQYPCCSNNLWCGIGSAHCTCEGCLDYRITGLAYRLDRRCGGNFIAPNGEVARCDPDGRYPCCSNDLWCGSSSAHCDCTGCIDYRQ